MLRCSFSVCCQVLHIHMGNDTVWLHGARFHPCYYECYDPHVISLQISNVLFPVATCGGTIRGYGGHVTLPTYPGQYPNNLDCTWRLIGPPDHYLVLWFDELSMPYSYNCTAGDYVAVREQMPANSSGRIDLFCLT
jgi:hypothetical protein